MKIVEGTKRDIFYLTCNSEIEKKQVHVVRDGSLGGSDCEMVDSRSGGRLR